MKGRGYAVVDSMDVNNTQAFEEFHSIVYALKM